MGIQHANRHLAGIDFSSFSQFERVSMLREILDAGIHGMAYSPYRDGQSSTCSSGRGIHPWNASQEFQAHYYSQLLDWCKAADILAFIFEAFDEPWKGSPDPHEPEKHWGVFTVDRKPKLVMQELYSHL